MLSAGLGPASWADRCAGTCSRRGIPSTVYSRTRESAEALLEPGARGPSSPAEVAAASDVVFTMVGFPAGRARRLFLGASGVLRREPGRRYSST